MGPPTSPRSVEYRGLVLQTTRQNPDCTSLETASAETPSAANGRSVSTFLESLLTWLKQHWQIICLVLIFLSMHLYVLSFVNDLIYDEHFWVPEARHILGREPLDWPTYTALSKLFIASGIYILGDNSWGWRIPSVVFGAVSVVLVYLLARKLAGKRTALLASLLLVFENLFFTMTGLAMLDGFFLTFMLLSFLLYLHDRYALSGVSLALAVMCSPKAILAVVAILAHWFLVRRKRGFASVGLFAGTSLLAFFILMPITDFIATGEWFNPFGRIAEMWTTETSMSVSEWTEEQKWFTGPQYPWWWIINPRGMDLVPSRFHHYIWITPTVFFLIIPSIAYLLYRYFFIRKNRNAPRFIVLWFAATYLLWIPLELISDRPMFLYYFLPTVPAICVAIGYCLHRVWQKSRNAKDRNLGWLFRALLIFYLIVHIGIFLLISPLTAGLAEQ
jgi:dolichyl-phosphate-mannose-protein mannosyltransferase